MEILETKERKMNKIKREEREDLHTFSDTTIINPKFIIIFFINSPSYKLYGINIAQITQIFRIIVIPHYAKLFLTVYN